VYIKAGSRYEAVPGTAHALEFLAFRSTQQRSTIRLLRDMENAGASLAAVAGRESVRLFMDMLPA
jgi:predicted Zn-dependent peptidase